MLGRRVTSSHVGKVACATALGILQKFMELRVGKA